MRITKYGQATLLLNLFFFIGCFSPTFVSAQKTVKKQLTPRQIARQTLPSTVLLVMSNSETEEIKSGSGFFIAEDIVVTNFHVIQETTEGYAKIYGQNKTYEILGIVGMDEKNDLALLKIKGIKGKPLKLNTDDSIAIGDEVFAVGNPKGLEGTFSQGIISSIRKTGKFNLLQITASISAGSSGGAVLNDKGEVIGVAVGAIESGQSLNFAIPVSLLRSIVTKPKSPVSLASIKIVEQIKAGTVRKNSIGMELVYIQSGEFMMGSNDAEVDEAVFERKKYYSETTRDHFANEMPKHKVSIKKGFWMGKYEVTQGQWQAVMGDNPSVFKDCGVNCPVENVSWDDIQVFLRRLNAKDTQFEYSLPSEAQWEYAARAGTTTAFAFGDSLNSSQANFNGEYPYASTKGRYIGRTVAVGSYQPNNFGLYDMHGNVWEWCQDIYNPRYQNVPTDGSANISVEDSNWRVIRGGAFIIDGYGLRSAYRTGDPPTDRHFLFGFRVFAA